MLFTIIFISAVVGIVFAVKKAVDKYNKKLDEQYANEITEAMKTMELVAKIKAKLSRVSEITDAQMNLVSQMERPSASAAHSRYKNEVAQKIKSLEEEKIDIFRSILKDGFDPTLKVMNGDKISNIKMSEAVSLYESSAQSNSGSKTELKNSRKPVLKLVKGNKDDNKQTQPRSPTIH